MALPICLASAQCDCLCDPREAIDKVLKSNMRFDNMSILCHEHVENVCCIATSYDRFLVNLLAPPRDEGHHFTENGFNPVLSIYSTVLS